MRAFMLFWFLNAYLIVAGFAQTIDMGFGTNGYIHYSDENDHELVGLVNIDSSFIAATTLLNTSDGIDYSIRLFKFTKDGALVDTWGEQGILTFDIPSYTQTIARTILVDGDIVRIACEAANSTSEQRQLVLLELHEDGSFNTDFGNGGFKLLAFDNVTQNNIVKYYQKGDQHLLIGNLYRTFDFETNQYPFIIKLDETLEPDSSFNETGRLVIDNYRGHSNARPTHLEGGQAEDIYINDENQIVIAGYELLDPYNEEYLCKLDQNGNFIHHTGMSPYMSINNKIGILYNKLMLIPEQDDFTLVHSYFTGTKFQFGISQKDSLGQLSYLTTDNLTGYHHLLNDVSAFDDHLLAVGYQYETSSSNSSDDFFAAIFNPSNGSTVELWSASFIPDQTEGAESILGIGNHQFIIGGFSQHPDSSYKDLLITKIDASSILSLDERYHSIESNLVVNPASVKLDFLTDINSLKWSLLDMNGNTVQKGDKDALELSPDLKSGVYVLIVQSNKGIRTQRIQITD